MIRLGQARTISGRCGRRAIDGPSGTLLDRQRLQESKFKTPGPQSGVRYPNLPKSPSTRVHYLDTQYTLSLPCRLHPPDPCTPHHCIASGRPLHAHKPLAATCPHLPALEREREKGPEALCQGSRFRHGSNPSPSAPCWQVRGRERWTRQLQQTATASLRQQTPLAC